MTVISSLLRYTLALTMILCSVQVVQAKNVKSKSTKQNQRGESKRPVSPTQQTRSPTRKYIRQPTQQPQTNDIASPTNKSIRPSRNPTKQPTLNPTFAFSMKHTAHPVMNPISLDVGSSSSKPSTSCIDSMGIFKWTNGQAVDCLWVAKNSDSVCSRVIAKSKCPKTCCTCGCSTREKGKGEREREREQ